MRQNINFFSLAKYQEIVNAFDIGKIKQLDYFKKGFRTPNVKVKTRKGSYVIKRYPLGNKNLLSKTNKKSLQWEIDLLKHVKGLPVPVNISLKKSSNNFILHFNNSLITVHYYIIGKEPKNLTPNMVFQLGFFLKDFHQRCSTFYKPFPKTRKKWYYFTPKIIENYLKDMQRIKKPYFKNFIEEILDGVLRTNVVGKKYQYGPIHVDLKPENELFIGEKLTGVLDFGNVYIGPLIVDIGKAVMWNCVNNKKLKPALVQSLLKGYYGNINIAKDYKDNIRKATLFAIYSHIFIDLWHLPDKAVPESYTAMLLREFLPVARWLENNELPI